MANRDIAAVQRDIRDGKAVKVRAERITYGVWNGCRFHFLKADHNTYRFADGSEAGVSENPDNGPPANCVGETRNPTAAEMADMNRHLALVNPRQPHVPGGPPPPMAGDRPADAFAGT